MFKFDFDIDDGDDVVDQIDRQDIKNENEAPQASQSPDLEPFSELSIAELLEALPSLISYSPLTVPLSSSQGSIVLLRRDLFDARFQLISEGVGDPEEGDDIPDLLAKKKALEFLENPSDLVRGVYEGGLKTWECSLDLVDHLDHLKNKSSYRFSGKNIIELGCGTGVPSAYILHEILSSEGDDAKTILHLQDYNSSVLQLVTLPNLLLAWYASPQASQYKSTSDDEQPRTSEPGELSITPELKTAFLESLDKRNISLRFFSGSWETFAPTKKPSHYNLLLTSETIYRLESLPTLTRLMQDLCNRPYSTERKLEDVTFELQIKAPFDSLCLVAAKVLYFGVGGGIPDFINQVQKIGGHVETVLERKVGVGRKVINVNWQ